MNAERLFLVNPFNAAHLALIDEFETENEISTKTSEFLSKFTSSMSEEEYDIFKKTSNEYEESLFIEENNKVTDSCHIQIEKDIKSCNISFAPIKTKLRNRRLLTLATEYALNSLGMVEVFISIQADDKNMIANLEARGFESLGEENGKIIYLKEKELLQENRIVI